MKIKNVFFLTLFSVVSIMSVGCAKEVTNKEQVPVVNMDTDNATKNNEELDEKQEVLEPEIMHFLNYNEIQSYSKEKVGLIEQVFTKYHLEYEVAPDQMFTYVGIEEDKYAMGKDTIFRINYASMPDFYNEGGEERLEATATFGGGLESFVNEPQFKTLVDTINIVCNLTYSYEEFAKIIDKGDPNYTPQIYLEDNPQYSIEMGTDNGMSRVNLKIIRPFTTEQCTNYYLQIDTIDEFLTYEKAFQLMKSVAEKHRLVAEKSENEITLRSIEEFIYIDIRLYNVTGESDGKFTYTVNINTQVPQRNLEVDLTEADLLESTEKFIGSIIADILTTLGVNHEFTGDAYGDYFKSSRMYGDRKVLSGSRANINTNGGQYYDMPFSNDYRYNVDNYNGIEYILKGIKIPVKIDGKTKQTF
ncbi:MAG TPA: hypothetical protein GX707_12495 [Epulopiscium sp.]|nr:hypothetical protein [Candidatus Epulonipiscium sp.]